MVIAKITFSPAKAGEVKRSTIMKLSPDQRVRLAQVKDIKNKPLDFAQALASEMQLRGRETTITEMDDGSVQVKIVSGNEVRLKKVCNAYKSFMLKLLMKAAGVKVESELTK